MRAIDNPEVFKAGLERWLAIFHDKSRDIHVRRTALIAVFEALDHFFAASDEVIHKMLEPVLRQLCEGFADLANGRQSEIFKPAPHKGKRRPWAGDLQPQARAALYMHLKVPGLGKDKARAEAARKFEFDATSIDYWRDQAMNGDENGPWTALFQQNLRVLTAIHPNSPEKQAAALLDAHKRSLRR
jgi:hypothetical protein